MKSLVASAMIVFGMSSTALAFPNAAEMHANFKTCRQIDESWMRRFGQYLVSFDFNTAAEICRTDPAIDGPAQVMACRHDGRWLYAGYYCSVPPYSLL